VKQLILLLLLIFAAGCDEQQDLTPFRSFMRFTLPETSTIESAKLIITTRPDMVEMIPTGIEREIYGATEGRWVPVGDDSMAKHYRWDVYLFSYAFALYGISSQDVTETMTINAYAMPIYRNYPNDALVLNRGVTGYEHHGDKIRADIKLDLVLKLVEQSIADSVFRRLDDAIKAQTYITVEYNDNGELMALIPGAHNDPR